VPRRIGDVPSRSWGAAPASCTIINVETLNNTGRSLSAINSEVQQQETPQEPDATDSARPLLPSDTPGLRPIAVVIAIALIIVAAIRYDDISRTTVVAVYIAVFVACAITDLTSFRVPNVISYPAIIFALLIGAFMPDSDFRESLAGGAAAGGLMLFALIISRGAMGLGDVKLATVAGLALGWPLVAPALMLMALSGGATAFLLLLLRLRGRRDPIPYAPFISVATVAVILWQGTVFVEL